MLHHRFKIPNIKDFIKFKLQKAKKGYCDYDIYSIHSWFINIFPKMLEEFAENTCGTPCDTDDLIAEVDRMPCDWILDQRPIIDKITKKYDIKFDTKDSMTCWLLILLRMKYCFELCDEWHSHYDGYMEMDEYEKANADLKKYYEEGFYLFKKYFFDLWW